MTAKPTSHQYRELANAIARQAEALSEGLIPEGRVHAHVARLAANMEMLQAWTPDDREAPLPTWRDARQ